MKPRYFSLILLVLSFLSVHNLFAQQKDSGIISRRPELTFQNRKHPEKLSNLPLPAVVKAKLKPHDKWRFYILRGSKDSILSLNLIRHKPYRKFKEDSARINIPFDSVVKISYFKYIERGGLRMLSWYYLSAGIGLASELGAGFTQRVSELNYFFRISFVGWLPTYIVICRTAFRRHITPAKWKVWKNEMYNSDKLINFDFTGRNVIYNNNDTLHTDTRKTALVLQNKKDTANIYAIYPYVPVSYNYSPGYTKSALFLGRNGNLLKFRLTRNGSNLNDSATLIIPFEAVGNFTVNWFNHINPRDWKIIAMPANMGDDERLRNSNDDSLSNKPLIIFQKRDSAGIKKGLYAGRVRCSISPKYRRDVILLGCKDSVLTLKVRYAPNWIYGQPDTVIIHIPFDSIKRIDYNITPEKWRIIAPEQDSIDNAKPNRNLDLEEDPKARQPKSK